MNYTEKTAIERLKKNRGMVSGKKISGSFSIALWGAVDYLVGKHGYIFWK